MKKMIIGMVGLTLIVASVQAAAINWSTGNVNTLAVNSGQSYTTDWQGQTVAFYLVTAGYDLSSIITGLQANNLTVLTGLTQDCAAALGSGSKGAGGVGTKEDYTDGDKAYGFALVQNKNASLAPGTVDFAISAVVQGTCVTAFSDFPIDFGGTAGFKTYDAVPEPTSMALLALGIAAIGLRRRFKK